MRIALGLQYDGSLYSGWQSQLKQKTVQDELENALAQFIGIEKLGLDPVRVITAGRTDAGVHALGQVVHFDAPVERESFSWVRGVNSFLPSSIVVNWAQPVSEEFSARYSAYQRTYIYALHAGPYRSPMADASNACIHWADCLPTPICKKHPTKLRTIWCKKAFPVILKYSQG